jgi:hypothetical protein
MQPPGLEYNSKGTDMSIIMKVFILVAILVSDAICGVVLSRKLNEQGKGNTAKIILPALGSSTIIIGIILFVAL